MADQTNDWKHLQRLTYAREWHTDHLETEMRRNRKRCASKIQGEGAEIKRRRRGGRAARAQPSSGKAPREPPSFGAGRRGFPPLRAPAVVTPRGFPCPDAGGLKVLRAVRSRRPLGAGDPRVCETAERENGLTHPEAPGAAVRGRETTDKQLSSPAALRT